MSLNVADFFLLILVVHGNRLTMIGTDLIDPGCTGCTWSGPIRMHKCLACLALSFIVRSLLSLAGLKVNYVQFGYHKLVNINLPNS